MPRARKTHPPSLKAPVAVEAIRGVLTAAEIAKKFDVHPNLAANWKRQAPRAVAGPAKSRAGMVTTLA